MSLGLAVNHLRTKPVFAMLRFGSWSSLLAGQINRGHACFAVDVPGHVRGFLGWALVTEALAEAWVAGRTILSDEDCRQGDCIIFTAWSADSPPVHQLVLDEARRVIGGRRKLYFWRNYPDGRSRPVRLPATSFSSVQRRSG